MRLLLSRAVALLFLFSYGSRLLASEPVYQDKTVTEWAAELSKNPWSLGRPIAPAYTPGAQALLHFGTNAVPYLVRELEVRDSKLKQEVTQLFYKQSVIDPPLADVQRHYNALGALSVLGPLGKEAIPALTNFLYAGRPQSKMVIWTLATMGPDAVGPLACALRCSDSQLQRYAAGAFWQGSIEGAEAAIPALLACLEDPDCWVRVEAMRALAAIGKRPERVIPAIRERLTDTNQLVVRTAEKALARFSTKAGEEH